jgi:hypothetical protein
VSGADRERQSLTADGRRIRVIATPHRGLVAALNTGRAAARAALSARMDADDLCLPERFRCQRRRLAERPDVGLAACWRAGADFVLAG